MADKYQVRILSTGKAATEVEADDAREAVGKVVTDFARRAGESAHMMARRLDKVAEVRVGKGAPMFINIIETCPEPAKGMEADLADEIAQVLASQARIAPGEDDGMSGP